MIGETQAAAPEWLIDDTAEISTARMFAMHTRRPMLIGEILPADEAPIDGITFGLLNGDESLCRIYWIDEPGDDDDLLDLAASLDEALANHYAIRGDD